MLNYQGQPLTPIERGLNRAAPGFSMLLGSIQGLANKVEENKRLAEERNYQTRRDQTLFDQELEKIEISSKAQYTNQVNLNKQKAGLDVAIAREKSKIEINQKIRELGIEGSPLGLAVTQNQAEAQSRGTTAGKKDERDHAARLAQLTRDNNSITSLYDTIAKYPSISLKYPDLRVVNGQWYNGGQPVNINTIIGIAAADSQLGTLIGEEFTKRDYTPDTARNAVSDQKKLITGELSALTYDVNNFVSQVQRVDQEAVRTQNADVIAAGRLTGRFLGGFNTSTAPYQENIRNSSTFKNQLPKGKFSAFSDQEFRVNAELATLMAQTKDEDQLEVLTNYLNNKLVSLYEVETGLRAYATENEDESLLEEIKRIELMSMSTTKVNAGDPVFFNPFANSDRPFFAVGSAEIAEQIIGNMKKYREKRQNYFLAPVISDETISTGGTAKKMQIFNFKR